jgi:hypothetical protein
MGGAIDVDAWQATSPVSTISNDVLSGNSTTGGRGGSGGNGPQSGLGGTGGGGASLLFSATASNVTISVSATGIANNSAIGGIGGTGGTSAQEHSEAGGSGGASFGGGVMLTGDLNDQRHGHYPERGDCGSGDPRQLQVVSRG